MDERLFAEGLTLFWALWFGIVFLTNTFGALRAAGRLRPGWKFASKNFESVAKAVSLYSAPPWVARALFAGVIAWQLAAAALYAAAFAAYLGGHASLVLADLAFGAGIGLFAAFMLADEITLKFAYEQSHELLLVAQLASLGLLHAFHGGRFPA
jgi:hypothetical protein